MRWWALAAPLAVLLALSGCLNTFDDASGNALRLTTIDVAAPVVRSGEVQLLVNATLDNAGAQSGHILLHVKAYDVSTGLLTATQDKDAGRIPKDVTRTVEVPLPVPRAPGYRIEVHVFQDDRLLLTGRVTVTSLDALAPNVFDQGLRISMMDFIVRNVSGQRVEIEAKVYLTNEGAAASKALQMQVKAREVTTEILADEAWTDVEAIGPDESVAFPVLLTVPEAYNYHVEAILWDGNFIVERGAGAVQLLPTFVVDPDREVVVTQPDVSEFIRASPPAPGTGPMPERTSAPAAAFALLGVLLALLLARSLQRRPPA